MTGSNEMVTALVRAADPTFPNGGRKVMAEAPLMERLDFYAAMVRSKIFTRSALAVAFFLLYRPM